MTALEQFRNETLLQARKGSAADVEAVRGHFGELERVLEGFEAWLWELGRLALELCRRGREDTLVILLKICEVESQADEKVRRLAASKDSSAPLLSLAADTGSSRPLTYRPPRCQAAATKLAFMALKRPSLRSVQAEARPIKHYRHRLLELLRSSIAATFDEAWRSVEGSVPDFLDQLGAWLYQDLYRIANVLVPCFPPDWQIHALYVKGYHANLDRILGEIVRSTPEASVLLQLYSWVKEYKASMRELSEELALPAEWTQPPLLGGKEQDLIEDYVGLIVRKMDEWTTNLLRDEAREFTVRDQPVEIDDGGQYFLQGTVIMFSMINQQVDLAADSGQAKILARTFDEAKRVMKLTQARFGALVRDELKRSVERPDESPPGLVEYVMALANDQLKSADRAEELGGRCEGMVSDKLAVTIAANVNDAIDGYLDVAKVCAQALIDLVFHDLRAATKLFFAPAWYSEAERPMPAVVETMRDYLLDYRAHLNPSIFELLLADMLETLLVLYVSGLRKASKLRMASAVDLIRADVGQLYELFAEFRPADALERDFEVVEMVLAILAAGKELVFLDYWTFAKIHGPNVAFVEGLLRARCAGALKTLPSSRATELTTETRRLAWPPTETTLTARLSTRSWRQSSARSARRT